jgi:hypothetical protein
MRPPIMIIGAHRSGTSATAHALQLLGLQIGQKLDSHYEPKPLQKLHEEYLRRVGASWHNPGPFLESIGSAAGQQRCIEYLRTATRNFARLFGYRKNPPGLWMLSRLTFGAAWGWKEPRTTLFAPIWLKIFSGAKLLHVLRDETAAARSIRERELKFRAAGDPPAVQDLDRCVDIVRSYVAAAARLANSENYLRVQFEDVQNNPAEVLERAASFCGLEITDHRLRRAAATIRRNDRT